MKIWIVGACGTGKYEVLTLLKNDNYKCGKLFTNATRSEMNNKYAKNNYLYYSHDDVKSIFENNAYVFINNVPGLPDNIYEGLSLDNYEKNDVFILTPYQFISIPQMYLDKDDNIIIWLDASRKTRLRNSQISGDYDILFQNTIEQSSISTFTNYIASINNVIYFNNELPERVKTIIKVILDDERLKYDFLENYK